MALNLLQLQPSCGFDGVGPRIWSYKSQDTLGAAVPLAGEIQFAGYFDGASDVLAEGDFIVILSEADLAAPGSLTAVVAVRDITGGVVTISPPANDIEFG